MRTRRTLWYRIFCSSPVRMGASILVVTYFLVWNVVVPTTNILLDYGRMLSGGRYHHGFMDSAKSFPLIPIDQQRKQVMRLEEERDRLQNGSPERHDLRVRLWEDIVPEWLHRNSVPKTTTVTKPPAPANSVQNTAEAAERDEPGPLSNGSKGDSKSKTRESGKRQKNGDAAEEKHIDESRKIGSVRGRPKQSDGTLSSVVPEVKQGTVVTLGNSSTVASEAGTVPVASKEERNNTLLESEKDAKPSQIIKKL